MAADRYQASGSQAAWRPRSSERVLLNKPASFAAIRCGLDRDYARMRELVSRALAAARV